MKITRQNRSDHALTLGEVVVVIFVLVLLTVMLMPTLSVNKRKRDKLVCVNHLKEMGMGFRAWEGDNNDKYPMTFSATNGGAMEFAARGNAEAIFQAMSNTLSNPKILVCPADKDRQPAPSFSTLLTSRNISYFINLDASEANPQDMLFGDDNFEVGGRRVASGWLEISPAHPVVWSSDRHGFGGYVAVADGSVQAVSNLGLRNWLRTTNSFTRLAIP